MRSVCGFLLATLLCTVSLQAQTTPQAVAPVLAAPIQPVAVTAYQVQRYMMARIPRRPVAENSEQWTSYENKLREHFLNDIAFHGWPRAWVDSPPHFEEVGTVQNGKGYHWRKLRYEVVPGYWSTAILYEPEKLEGKVPAILYVQGHEHSGKVVEYAQKACINFARRGIVVLDPEWIGMGELFEKLNAHDYGSALDLVGANALGLFYLAMRRGLDYLTQLPQVDAARLGVTGLSGGGWQTIVLSALDPRVAVMVEVAGFGSFESNLTHPADTDDIEETPTDFLDGADYADLVAMRAPRPTLLIHNAEDDCCFRAMLVKPYIFEENKPFFQIYGAEPDLAYYENRVPGTHNYQLDNRLQAYRFFTEHFHLPVATTEIPAEADLKSVSELNAGLPANNLTTLGLAKKFAAEIVRSPIPAESAARDAWARDRRTALGTLIRYKPVSVANAWRMWNTKKQDLETLSYRFDFSNDLSATGVWLKSIAAPAGAPATIVLNDKGRKAASETVAALVNHHAQVLALDLVFNGETVPQSPDPTDYEMLIASMGDRPLGLEVAQLVGAAKWLKEVSGQTAVRLEATGIRSQVVALAAAALEPALFSEVATSGGMRSLQYLLDAPVPQRSAPELFCLDLYKEFDLDQFLVMSAPAKISQRDLR